MSSALRLRACGLGSSDRPGSETTTIHEVVETSGQQPLPAIPLGNLPIAISSNEEGKPPRPIIVPT